MQSELTQLQKDKYEASEFIFSRGHSCKSTD